MPPSGFWYPGSPGVARSPRRRPIARRVAAAVGLAAALTSGTDPGRADSPSEGIDAALRRLNGARQDGLGCESGAGVGHGAAALPALRWNERLAEAARRQATEMAALQRLEHRDRVAGTLAARLATHGYRLGVAVENVAFGPPTVEEAIDAWRASAAHCANLMNTAVVEVGLGVAQRDGTRWWALVLAAPSGAVAAPPPPALAAFGR